MLTAAVRSTLEGCLQADPRNRFVDCAAIRRSLLAPVEEATLTGMPVIRLAGCLSTGFVLGFALVALVGSVAWWFVLKPWLGP